MKRLIVALALVLFPLAAHADKASYCAEMSDLALRYLGKYSQGRAVYDVDITAAIDQCQRGNYDKGIPSLERRLRNNGFTLPKQ